MITFVEYDANGELIHVAEIHTAEGRDVAQLPANLTDEERAAHDQAVADAIAARENATRDALAAHAAGGASLLVLPAGAATPAFGRFHVDVATKKLNRRTDAELAAFRAQQAAAGRPS